MASIYLVFCALLFGSYDAFVVLEQNGFKGLHVFVSPSVPSTDWPALQSNLINAFNEASVTMYYGTGTRAYFKDFTVVLPREWDIPNQINYKQINDLECEMTVHDPTDSVSLYRQFPYADHSRQCRANGDMMHFPSSYFEKPNDAGDVDRLMLKTWMSYRYGMYDELGYPQDTKYPAVYCDANGAPKATQCSNVPLTDSKPTFFSIRGQESDCDCKNKDLKGNLIYCVYVPLSDDDQHDDLYSSLMGFHHIYRIQTFCDTESDYYIHDTEARNIHNGVCENKSILDTMLLHQDFQHGHNPPAYIEDIEPRPSVVQQRTKIVFILDTNGNIKKDIGSMVKSMLSEWMKDFALFMHVGVVAVSGRFQHYETVYDIQQLRSQDMVDNIIKQIEDVQYTGKGSRNQIQDGLQYSIDMGDLNSIMVLISDGNETVPNSDILNCKDQIKRNNINIVAIDIGQSRENDKMKELAGAVNQYQAQGLYFYAGENPLLVHDALATTARTFSYPHPSKGVKIVSSMKKSGTFWIDESLGTVEITFHLLSQMNTEDIRKIVLLNNHNDQEDLGTVDLPKVTKTVNVGQDTIGQWSYAVTCDDCSVGVYVTGLSKDLNSVIDMDCQVLTTQINGANVGSRIVAKLMKGKMPIIGASVSANLNDGTPIGLSDDGDTGMDAIKQDGIYTIEVPGDTEEGTAIQCVVNGKSSEAISAHPGFEDWYQAFSHTDVKSPLCCGSAVADPGDMIQLKEFTRIAVSNYYKNEVVKQTIATKH